MSDSRTAAWDRVKAMPQATLAQLFVEDDGRVDALSGRIGWGEGEDAAGIRFDWSKTHLTDDLLAGFEALAEAGASSVTTLPMHLRSSTKDWFMSWLATNHPALVRRYRQLYGDGAYVTPEYTAWLRRRIDPLLERHGFAAEQAGPVEDILASPSDVPAKSSAAPTDRTPALTLF